MLPNMPCPQQPREPLSSERNTQRAVPPHHPRQDRRRQGMPRSSDRTAIGEAGGIVGAVDLVEVDGSQSLRDIVVDASGREHWEQIIAAIDALERRGGDRHDRPHVPAARGRQDRTAQQAPAEDARRPLDGLHAGRRARVAWRSPTTRTRRSSTRSSATRSPSSPTAPRCSDSATSARAAAMPVMEGKCCLFKEFAGVDAFPICLDTTRPRGDRAHRRS